MRKSQFHRLVGRVLLFFLGPILIATAFIVAFGVELPEMLANLVTCPPDWIAGSWVRIGAALIGGVVGWWWWACFNWFRHDVFAVNRQEILRAINAAPLIPKINEILMFAPNELEPPKSSYPADMSKKERMEVYEIKESIKFQRDRQQAVYKHIIRIGKDLCQKAEKLDCVPSIDQQISDCLAEVRRNAEHVTISDSETLTWLSPIEKQKWAEIGKEYKVIKRQLERHRDELNDIIRKSKRHIRGTR